MPKGLYQIPYPDNEPVLGYAPGSEELESLLSTYHEMLNQEPIDMPMYIGAEKVRTSNKMPINPPHDHAKVLGHFNYGDASHVTAAIDAALDAKAAWSSLPWEHRASIFLKAAELLAGPFRDRMNAATMLAQSKNVMQAEIDAACELIDFFRFNAYLMQEMYSNQPDSQPGIWNRMEYRPLEGFVFAISPFNFTSIAANLPASAAMMGNTVVWKPSETQMYSAQVIMDLFKAAGLPDGVINLISVEGPVAGGIVFKHNEFAGLHFTGSTGVFQTLWKEIGTNIDKYHSYPRIVGETGGKDFIMVHSSAEPQEVRTAISRGAFEFQGQKCSAASRAYIPSSMWNEVKEGIVEDLASFKMGSPEDPSNFINAVIDKRAFDKISGFIDYAKESADAEIIAGGNYDGSKGYFIEPTVILAKDPKFKTMCEEIFGPVMTIYVYEDRAFEETMSILNQSSPYALTGSIFSGDRYAIDLACKALEDCAGNFYINDKPTGAVVNQQPFGGARGSGTNDKAGSMWNLIRWVSPRTIKETFVPPTDYRYPFLG
ncbi:MAG: L-glutamate gamma-semialdehyde dehydrogenase [Flavobacteriales bacterium]|jgi:1-pyrroline-5-carboxylate dehydrogenase|nr:L-glutamate gamma-semialdehyde dehydrogenase [Flavobacteriales bacterium]MBT3963749.1 L-glutamate gamma-semialdehyde dehydrogenase [Flavobacteriales bacterium]MBT4704100.1 L-glutamate gamma-semialdehyde dehydrogenase [Flavobacteriales bacterium]MBT4930747.1 L-glutamate gamma-semialdehyde dehydrogenase [Flavobacteriales bacterium]MBT5132080.1 L-glutamate gamma-semialdehyde dehydrogenase [Flavobacteriales bacterium]